MIELVDAKDLKPASWRSTYTLKPDVKLLVSSLTDYGWLQNLVVNSDGTIIDGYVRSGLALTNKGLIRKFNGKVPVLEVTVDDIDARIMHVKMNRARGQIVPRYMSALVKDVLRSKKYDPDELKKMLNMTIDEFTLLQNGSLFKQRNLDTHVYSKAWTPIESNGNEIPVIERPPTPDK